VRHPERFKDESLRGDALSVWPVHHLRLPCNPLGSQRVTVDSCRFQTLGHNPNMTVTAQTPWSKALLIVVRVAVARRA
jgi:hypothetical protein